MINFSELGLEQWLVKVCAKINFKEPRTIQQITIPQIIKGNNTLISSQTGSGKTAAFAFPILQDLSRDPYGIFALILTISRELAMQIYEQISLFGAPMGVRITLLIGGMPIQKQINELSRIPHIVIATPGRCMSLLQSDESFQKYIKNVKYLVLDEVDRLLEAQVWAQIEQIRSALDQENIRVHLVSATLDSVMKSQEGYKTILECFPNKIFAECIANKTIKVAETIKHKYILMPQLVKDFYLIYLIQNKIGDQSKIIFVPTCRKCQEMSLLLNRIGVNCVSLHSMLKQKERIQNLRRFRKNESNTLICTDVAARGLDLPDVKFVVNWNIPQEVDDYIHRVGRTARGGKRGTGITLITQFDIERVLSLEQALNIKLEEIKFNEEKVLEDMSSLSKLMRKIKVIMAEDGTTEWMQKKSDERKQLKQKQIKQQKQQLE